MNLVGFELMDVMAVSTTPSSLTDQVKVRELVAAVQPENDAALSMEKPEDAKMVLNVLPIIVTSGSF